MRRTETTLHSESIEIPPFWVLLLSAKRFTLRQEVETENVQARETIRREELDVESDGDVIQR